MPASARTRWLPAITPQATARPPATDPTAMRRNCWRSPSSMLSPMATRKPPSAMYTRIGAPRSFAASSGSRKASSVRVASRHPRRYRSNTTRSAASSCSLSIPSGFALRPPNYSAASGPQGRKAHADQERPRCHGAQPQHDQIADAATRSGGATVTQGPVDHSRYQKARRPEHAGTDDQAPDGIGTPSRQRRGDDPHHPGSEGIKQGAEPGETQGNPQGRHNEAGPRPLYRPKGKKK